MLFFSHVRCHPCSLVEFSNYKCLDSCQKGRDTCWMVSFLLHVRRQMYVHVSNGVMRFDIFERHVGREVSCGE